jgi:predicted ABC-type ATPase
MADLAQATADHNRRRFDSGLRNFQDIYMDLVDKWEWYDNSGSAPQLISERGSWR